MSNRDKRFEDDEQVAPVYEPTMHIPGVTMEKPTIVAPESEFGNDEMRHPRRPAKERYPQVHHNRPFHTTRGD